MCQRQVSISFWQCLKGIAKKTFTCKKRRRGIFIRRAPFRNPTEDAANSTNQEPGASVNPVPRNSPINLVPSVRCYDDASSSANEEAADAAGHGAALLGSTEREGDASATKTDTSKTESEIAGGASANQDSVTLSTNEKPLDSLANGNNESTVTDSSCHALPDKRSPSREASVQLNKINSDAQVLFSAAKDAVPDSQDVKILESKDSVDSCNVSGSGQKSSTQTTSERELDEKYSLKGENSGNLSPKKVVIDIEDTLPASKMATVNVFNATSFDTENETVESYTDVEKRPSDFVIHMDPESPKKTTEPAEENSDHNLGEKMDHLNDKTVDPTLQKDTATLVEIPLNQNCESSPSSGAQCVLQNSNENTTISDTRVVEKVDEVPLNQNADSAGKDETNQITACPPSDTTLDNSQPPAATSLPAFASNTGAQEPSNEGADPPGEFEIDPDTASLSSVEMFQTLVTESIECVEDRIKLVLCTFLVCPLAVYATYGVLWRDQEVYWRSVCH